MESGSVRTSPLAVVMPAYDEEGAIRAAVEEVQRHILDCVDDAYLVVVNDGSRDATGLILDEIAEADPRVRPVHRSNGGHGPALISGIEAGESEWLFLLDSDRQIPLDDFPDTWAMGRGGADAVFGVRRSRDDPFVRLTLTRLIRLTLAVLFGVRVEDANVPYKLFRRALWAEAKGLISPDTLAPSLFLTIFAERCGYAIAYHDVRHRSRATGQASIKRWSLFRFCVRAFGQLLTFRKELRRVR